MRKTKSAEAVFTASEVRKYLNAYQTLVTMRSGNRPRVSIERGSEEKSQLKPFDRLEAIAIGRDLNRSNSKAITILNQRSVLVCGKVKAQFNTSSDSWNRAASNLFNRVFARDCYLESPMHLAQVAQLVEAAKIREGDCLVVYDDFLLDSGKLIIYEADQLVSVAPRDWEEQRTWGSSTPEGWKPYFQEQGVVRNEYGIVVAYTVTRDNLAEKYRGSTTLPLSEVTVIPADKARLVKRSFRFGQRRGVPALLPVSDNLADIDEMVKSELSTAKMRGKLMAFVKHAAANADAEDAAAILAELEKRDAAEESTDSTSSSQNGAEDVTNVEERPRYRTIEAATGGATEYLADGDDLAFPAIDRPNLDVATFYNMLGDVAGSAVGLAKAYTRMEATASYTAHRGETCMTFRHIKSAQKEHEHQWLDWLAEKVIRRAVRLGQLVEGPENWQFLVSWDWDKPDAIDPEKEARADLQNLKNGRITLRDLVGPDWKQHFRDFAEQIKFALKMRLPLSIFETVAGAAAVPEEDNKGDNE